MRLGRLVSLKATNEKKSIAETDWLAEGWQAADLDLNTLESRQMSEFSLLNLHIEKRENHTAVNTKRNKSDCVVCEGELLGAQVQVNICKRETEKRGK